MSWGAVIAGGVALTGSILSQRSAKKQAAAANESSAQSLAFAQQQYDDWKAIYGPIQENLSSYYSNLTPSYYATVGLENFEKERQSALEDLDTSLAQRGIKNSGVATQLKTEERIDAASQRAQIRRGAQDAVAQQQQNFLSVGNGNSPVNNLQGVLNNNAANARNLANASAQAAGSAAQSATTALGSLLQTGLSSYLSSSNSPTTSTSKPNNSYSWQNYV